MFKKILIAQVLAFLIFPVITLAFTESQGSAGAGNVCNGYGNGITSTSTAACPAAAAPLNPIKLKLAVPIPGLEAFSQGEGVTINNDTLPQYIGGIYKFFVGIAGILAVFMIMFGGIQWLFAGGSSDKISSAKETIFGAVIGLILALCSYSILYFINPKLVQFGTLNISTVPVMPGDLAGPIISTTTIGEYCPHSGGQDAIIQIVDSLNGKVTYRMGGKGGPPPYAYASGNCDCGQCSQCCPAGTLCFDCSGFVGHVLSCAGLTCSHCSGGTEGLFTGAESVTNISGDGLTVNGQALQIGDLLGWLAAESSDGSGHVIIFLGNVGGNGLFADSNGYNKNAGKAVMTFSISQYQNRIKHIRRMPNL